MSQTAAQIVTSATRLRRLSEEAAWQLIRAQNAHVILAILRSNFVESGETRVPAPMLFERIDDDLVALRGAGYDLPQTAQQYCAAWLNQGYLERRPGEIGGDETVMSQLDQLVVDTDEDVASRVEALERDRDRLDARIAAIRDGRSGTIDDRVALERVRDILSLADQLPADFARVRREIERLNVRFRKDIIENDGGRGDVLEALFRGVDVLAEQEAGRSFQAFYALLTDLERSAGLDAAIETVLSRSFVSELTTAQQDFLRDLVPSLSQRGGEVHEVYVSLSRSLRNFVQRREYEEERTVSRLLTVAQRRFGVISETVPVHRFSGFELGLSQSELSSVGQWTPFSDDGERPPGLVENVAHDVDLAQILAIIRESEIDMRELQQNVASALEFATVVSVADVLARFPATQGFGSVVGLVYIALQRQDSGTAIKRDGQTETVQTETVQWNSDPARFAKVPRLLFTALNGTTDER